jgi:RNA polymerase sigma-70 factor (ECF subfamily)
MASIPDHDVTRLLDRLSAGDATARDRIIQILYGELRRLAAGRMRHERADHTLDPTALVHEAYLRLLGDLPSHWDNRGHFFAAASEVMRRLLVDYARQRLAAKRGGDFAQVALAPELVSLTQDPSRILAVDEALARLEEVDPEKARLVRLRFFAGLDLKDIGDLMGISERTAKRHWQFAKAWLYREIGYSGPDRPE